MTDEGRFVFDLQGDLVVKGVLSDAELQVLNTMADAWFDRYAGAVGPWRTHRCSTWGQPLVDLIDHDRLIPYLLELVGPYFRLDRDYCIFLRRGDRLDSLHGGSDPRRSPGITGTSIATG